MANDTAETFVKEVIGDRIRSGPQCTPIPRLIEPRILGIILMANRPMMWAIQKLKIINLDKSVESRKSAQALDAHLFRT